MRMRGLEAVLRVERASHGLGLGFFHRREMRGGAAGGGGSSVGDGALGGVRHQTGQEGIVSFRGQIYSMFVEELDQTPLSLSLTHADVLLFFLPFFFSLFLMGCLL